jgi:hypothetical protein
VHWLFRYITREMVNAKAIEKRDIPMFLSGWLDKSSENCMFDEFLLKTWKLPQLRTGAWFLECPRTACPAEEQDLLAQADAHSGTPLPSEGLGESEEEVEITAAVGGSQAAGSTPHPTGSTSRSSRRARRRSQETAPEMAQVARHPVHGMTKGKGRDPSSQFPAIPLSQSTASTFSSEFCAFQPPHLRAFSALAGVKHASMTSVLLVNDSLSAMLKVQESTGAFPTSFQDITSFLTKVVSQISSSA